MKYLVLTALLLTLGCSKKTEEITIIAKDGKNGTSCSVSQKYSESEDENPSVLLGAVISCTDGTFTEILNGLNGTNGINGVDGLNGANGTNGLNGVDAEACYSYRSESSNGVVLQCPGQDPVTINDGKNGASCSSVRQNSKQRVKITCGKKVSYVYDGKTGATGDSCTVTPVTGGAKVQCGSSTVTLTNGAQGAQGIPGTPGATGPQGLAGQRGADGEDGEDAVKPGISCNVHDLKNWNGITDILTTLASNQPVGSFVLPNLKVGDSPSSAGFPGMPSSLQNVVGVEGYALDCSGYLNITTSGLHTFKMLSDDGVRLVIDNQVIINNPSLHAPTTNVSSAVELQRGQRSFNVIYYQGPNTQIALQLKMSGPNTTEAVIPTALFTN